MFPCGGRIGLAKDDDAARFSTGRRGDRKSILRIGRRWRPHALLGAYRDTLWAVAALIGLASLLALRFPRDLKLLAPQPAPMTAAP